MLCVCACVCRPVGASLSCSPSHSQHTALKTTKEINRYLNVLRRQLERLRQAAGEDYTKMHKV